MVIERMAATFKAAGTRQFCPLTGGFSIKN
jgi:hypothetical protein